VPILNREQDVGRAATPPAVACDLRPHRSCAIHEHFRSPCRQCMQLSQCASPPLHLTTSKVMVIVWRSRGNIIRTVLFWQRATSSMGTVNKNSSHSPIGPRVCLYVFWVALFIFMFMYALFYLGQLSHFPSCFGAGVTNLNEPPSSFLLHPYYCGLGAGSIPFRAIVNKKQCETRGLFMSLVIHYWIGDVQDSSVYPPPKWPILCRVGR